jgi:hypothetical protein
MARTNVKVSIVIVYHYVKVSIFIVYHYMRVSIFIVITI